VQNLLTNCSSTEFLASSENLKVFQLGYRTYNGGEAKKKTKRKQRQRENDLKKKNQKEINCTILKLKIHGSSSIQAHHPVSRLLNP
jgi:hypothetical protein